MASNRSEIAQLRQQIEEQLIAMKRGLSGFSAGSARHAFINAKLERINVDQEKLASQIGEQDANSFFYHLYNHVMETRENGDQLNQT